MLSTVATYGERYQADGDSSLSLAVNRSARRGPWLNEEDQALLQLVRTQGANNWVRISQQLQHRSPKQCRERYHQNLKPSLKHDPISAQEGEIIERLVHEMGKRWAEIARRLGNRSDNAVKNWWNGSINRRRRNPAQSTTGFKQVGSRLQPIPLTLHADSVYSQRSESSFPTRNNIHTGIRKTSYETAQPNGFDASQIQGRVSIDAPPITGISQKPEVDLPVANSLPLVATSSPTSKGLRPSLPKVHTSDYRPELPPLRSSSFHLQYADRLSTMAERPPISPALSDTSQRQPPSLVSDNQSMYSISPRTVSTPRPGLPAPIEIAHCAWAENQTTAQCNHSNTSYNAASRSDSHARYLSKLPFDSGLRRYSTSITHEDKSRDSRMNVSTLLQ